MTLLQLSRNIAKLLDKDPAEVQEILELAFADISSTLIDEETVVIDKFGKWEIHHKGGKPHFKFFNYMEPVNNNIQLLNKYMRGTSND